MRNPNPFSNALPVPEPLLRKNVYATHAGWERIALPNFHIRQFPACSNRKTVAASSLYNFAYFIINTN